MVSSSEEHGGRPESSSDDRILSHAPARLIRIGYVVPPAPSFAGIERAVHTIANGLALDYGHIFDVHVISGSRHRELEVEDVFYRLHHLDVSRLRQVFRPLRACLDRHEFDMLVTAQCEMSSLAYVASRTSRLNRRVDLLTHLHGNPTIEEGKSAVNRALFAFYRAVVARRISATLAVSVALERTVRGSTLAGGHRVHYAPNPARSLGNGTLFEPGKPPHFVSVGRLSRQKGHDILLAAFAEVLLAHPDAHLDIVGGGEDEAELKALAARLRLGERVRFHGYMSDPSSVMRHADAFVLASRWEGFPLALIEAQSLGLPLVATDCQTGPAELIDQPWVGRLAPIEDAAAFADAMLQALTIPRGRAEDDRRRERASRFAPSVVARTHADLLRGIMPPRARTRLRGTLPGRSPQEA